MKHLNKIVVLILAVVSFNTMQAQDAENPWTLSFGLNGVSMRPAAPPSGEIADKFSNYFDVTGQWNLLPAVSYLSVNRHIKGGLSVGVTGSINKISKAVGYNAVRDRHYEYNPGNLSFYAVDVNGKYSFKEMLGSKYFDPFLYAGLGGTSISGSKSLSTNYGLGLNVWVLKGIAVSYQTGVRQQVTGSNGSHIQHLIGLTFGLGKKDQDKDGISDKDDACPTVPGLVQFKGCPDTDKDGVEDKEDECPEEAGLPELKGCPDADADGIADKDDMCPKEAGLLEFKGCADTDTDGVADKDDKCPKVAGPKENAGCPWPDTDGDGVLDKDDKCPKVKGAIENKGCPVVTKEVVKQLNDFLAKSVTFDTGKTTITKESFETLDGIVAIMTEYGNDKFEIQGHTDTVGKKASNQTLSEGRANSIKEYFLSKGVAADRLTSVGFGQDKPIASNKTKEGKALNRRVEIVHIVK